jgi:rubrerythrin
MYAPIIPAMPIPPRLKHLLLLAHSAERAAAYAYHGHAASVRDPGERAHLRRLEAEEWDHRNQLRALLDRLAIAPSPWLEWRFAVIGRIISAACHVIGHFLPMYFAGRLESANVNEYLTMADLARDTAIADAIPALLRMAQAEKDHESWLLSRIADHPILPIFRAIFRWGPGRSFNALASTALVTPAP